MARAEIDIVVTDTLGNVVPNADFTAAYTNHSGGLTGQAPIYATSNDADTTQLTGASLKTDTQGRIQGWLNEGDYEITISGGTPAITTITQFFAAVSGRGRETLHVIVRGKTKIGNVGPSGEGGIAIGAANESTTDVALYRTAAAHVGTSGVLDLSNTSNVTAIATGTGSGDKVALNSTTYGFGVQSSRLVAYVDNNAAFAVRQASGSGHKSSGTDAVTLSASGNVTATGTVTTPQVSATTKVVTSHVEESDPNKLTINSQTAVLNFVPNFSNSATYAGAIQIFGAEGAPNSATTGANMLLRAGKGASRSDGSNGAQGGVAQFYAGGGGDSSATAGSGANGGSIDMRAGNGGGANGFVAGGTGNAGNGGDTAIRGGNSGWGGTLASLGGNVNLRAGTGYNADGTTNTNNYGGVYINNLPEQKLGFFMSSGGGVSRVTAAGTTQWFTTASLNTATKDLTASSTLNDVIAVVQNLGKVMKAYGLTP